MPFVGVLFLVFLVLKLVGVIAWSWWYVCMPLYAIPVIALVAFLSAVGVLSFCHGKKCIRVGRTKKKKFDAIMKDQDDDLIF